MLTKKELGKQVCITLMGSGAGWWTVVSTSRETSQDEKKSLKISETGGVRGHGHGLLSPENLEKSNLPPYFHEEAKAVQLLTPIQ